MSKKILKSTVIIIVVLAIVLATLYYFKSKSSNQKLEQIDVSESGEYIPAIDSLTPTEGQLGTVIDIKGKNVKMSKVIFKSKTNNNEVWLRDSEIDRTIVDDNSVKIILKNPCVNGEVVLNRFMTTTRICDEYDKLVPGKYDVYLRTEDWEGNKVPFTIVAK